MLQIPPEQTLLSMGVTWLVLSYMAVMPGS